MDELSEGNRKKRLEDNLILRKSLLSGYTSKISLDNIKLRENARKLAMNILKNSRGKN